MANKQVVKVVSLTGEVLEAVKVRNVRICICGKEMSILQDGHDRQWKCYCMGELIPKCTRCEGWVYEDLCYPEDFDDTLGITFMFGHRHCMAEKAKELRKKRERAQKYFWKLVDSSKHEEVYHVINARTMTDVYCALKEKFGDKFYLYYDVTCNEYHIMSKGEIIGKLEFNDVVYIKKLK